MPVSSVTPGGSVIARGTLTVALIPGNPIPTIVSSLLSLTTGMGSSLDPHVGLVVPPIAVGFWCI